MTVGHWQEAARAALFFLLIGVLTIVITESAFNIMMRFSAYVPTQIRSALTKYYYDEDQVYVQFMPECAKYDPVLTYTLREGTCRFRGREFDTLITANSIGVRDDEKSLQSPEIVVLGDSIAMGWGVDNEENFAEQMEAAVNKKVLNLSVSSYGTVRELEIAKRANVTKLEYLILQYSPNDLLENQTFYEHGGVLPTSTVEEYRSVVRQHLRQTKYYFGKYSWWIVKTFTSLFWDLGKAEERNEAYFFFNALFSKYRELAERASLKPGGVTIILVGLNWGSSISKEALLKSTRPISIGKILSIELPPRNYFLQLDQHLNVNGHRELARRLISIIQNECSANNSVESSLRNCNFRVEAL